MSNPSEPQLSKNEHLKINDPTLSGTIAETLANPEVDRFSEDDEQFIKFHGLYQQDDRDKRKTGKTYICMVRARLPGGVVPSEQYLAFDELSDRYGNQTLRLTSRQSFQWHGVVKSKLGPLMKGLNDALCTTLAACGDVNRNVMAPPTPSTGPLVDAVLEDSRQVSDALLPTTPSYHEIWINGRPLQLSAEEKRGFVDPLYGRQYLPRKFKTAFAIPPLNDTDIFTNCLGFVAIADAADPSRLSGYNLLCGGGMGTSHGNKETFPRLADVLGYFPRERLVEVARAVVLAYRDSGDRSNRRHARLKYVLADRGADWFRAEVERRAGFALEPARPFHFERQGDSFGWQRQSDGRWFLGLYIETGRVADTPARKLKTALREVARRFGPQFRITGAQNLVLANIAEGDRAALSELLASHGVHDGLERRAVRRASMACVSLPTCGLALAESERFLPGLLDRIERLLDETGLRDEEIVVRVTGCPNGCARPFMAEIGLVGRAPGKYNLYLGGNLRSTRLNRLYKESVKADDLERELRPLLTRFHSERQPGEGFGDFCLRAGVLGETAATPSAT